jgi:hypothetical protein
MYVCVPGAVRPEAVYVARPVIVVLCGVTVLVLEGVVLFVTVTVPPGKAVGIFSLSKENITPVIVFEVVVEGIGTVERRPNATVPCVRLWLRVLVADVPVVAV